MIPSPAPTLTEEYGWLARGLRASVCPPCSVKPGVCLPRSHPLYPRDATEVVA